jgi:hypothetical protein
MIDLSHDTIVFRSLIVALETTAASDLTVPHTSLSLWSRDETVTASMSKSGFIDQQQTLDALIKEDTICNNELCLRVSWLPSS